MHNTFTFNLKSVEFFGQFWAPENDSKATVVLVHGMGEYCDRYKESIVLSLVKNNFNVVAFDQFGHGRTSGKKGHNPSFKDVLTSIDMVINKAKTLVSNKPVFLYGHSMGGNCVVNYVLRNHIEVKGVIASSPFLRLAFQPPSWKVFLGKLLLKIAPSITMKNEIDVKAISRDAVEVNKYINDPLIHDLISPNYSIAFIESGKWALDNAEKLKTPMLLVHGTGDQICDFKASEEFANKTSLADIILYDNGYHELHHDLCKEVLFQDLVNWLNTQL